MIVVKDGAKIGTVATAGTSTPNREFIIFDFTNSRMDFYRSNGLIMYISAGVYPGSDNLIPFGASSVRWTNGFFSTQLGLHDGTRFSISLKGNGAGYSGEKLMVLSHLNNVGSASVIGQRYKIQTNTGFVISVPGDTIATLGLMIAHEAFANGSYGQMMMLSPATDGQIIYMYFSAGTTAGNFANFDPANDGQFVSAVAPVVNQCAGIVMETRVGAGLALVMVQRQ